MARWRRSDARAKILVYAHARKELPMQLYRANISQPRRLFFASKRFAEFIGGLIVSQILTLYTKPVIYLLMTGPRTRKARAAA